MRYLSVCAGIEAATVAWHPLGWHPVAFSEIDSFACALLRRQYPTVPNWGDMNKFKEWPDATIDLLVGGTPCQSFSVAGLRQGLADPRGNLALTFLAIADRYRPRWVVWENVPGVLSSLSHDAPDPSPPPPPLDLGCDGAAVDTEDEYDAEELHAFHSLVAGFSKLGYHGAYGTLDAQYFNLAQRRARVFAVFYLGDWRRAAAVLFERDSLSGHPAPRREAWQGVAAGPTLGVAGGRNRGLGNANEANGLIPSIANCLGGSSQSGGFRTTDLDNQGAYIPEIVPQAMSAKWSKGSSGPAGDEVANLLAFEASHPVAFDTTQITHPENRSNPQPDDPCHPLAAGAHPPAIAFADLADPVAANQARTYTREGRNNFRLSNVAHTAMQVRRLTPRECERLQGFPDDYTLIPYRGKPAADGPRYKALGNSMAVPVMAWIGQRIALVEEVTRAHAADTD
jgi:DNA (cytosine-5)-methyltransferase 1